MSNNTSTALIEIGVLLVLVAISFGIWNYPWITLVLLGLALLLSCLGA